MRIALAIWLTRQPGRGFQALYRSRTRPCCAPVGLRNFVQIAGNRTKTRGRTEGMRKHPSTTSDEQERVLCGLVGLRGNPDSSITSARSVLMAKL